MKQPNDYPYWEEKARKLGFRNGMIAGFLCTILVAFLVEIIILVFVY